MRKYGEIFGEVGVEGRRFRNVSPVIDGDQFNGAGVALERDGGLDGSFTVGRKGEGESLIGADFDGRVGLAFQLKGELIVLEIWLENDDFGGFGGEIRFDAETERGRLGGLGMG